MKLWQIHVAEQMIVDDVEKNPDKYKGKKLSELSDDEEYDEESSIEYGEAYYKTGVVPKVTLVRTFRCLLLPFLQWFHIMLLPSENERQRTWFGSSIHRASGIYLPNNKLSFPLWRPESVFKDIGLFITANHSDSFVSYIQNHNKLREEAIERGEKYTIDKLRRNVEMDEYDLLHWRRSLEEREALIRDISW